MFTFGHIPSAFNDKHKWFWQISSLDALPGTTRPFIRAGELFQSQDYCPLFTVGVFRTVFTKMQQPLGNPLLLHTLTKNQMVFHPVYERRSPFPGLHMDVGPGCSAVGGCCLYGLKGAATAQLWMQTTSSSHTDEDSGSPFQAAVNDTQAQNLTVTPPLTSDPCFRGVLISPCNGNEVVVLL